MAMREKPKNRKTEKQEIRQALRARRAVVFFSAFLFFCFSAFPAASRAASPPDSDGLLPDPQSMARIEASIDRALEYLLKVQTPQGNWQTGRNGVNAFCLLAFLGRGHEPGRGPYRPVVDRAVAYLLTQQRDDGFFPQQMYDHALCTLALIEAYGFIPSVELRKKLQKAVDLIVKCQSPAGGWRYSPAPVDQDLSVTVMQVVALRAAQNARLEVPQKTIDQAIKFVKHCSAPSGGFGYTGPQPGPAMSAAGTLSMQLLGKFDDPSVAGTLAYMSKVDYKPGLAYFYYASYYAMQAHFQAGGDHWARWHPKARDILLSTQNEDGSWPGHQEEAHNGPTRCYSTSLAAICLGVYLHYLPAYQR
jgi:squalene cyclase